MKTKNTIKLTDDVIPAFAIHPGEHIKDEIEARALNQKEFALQMGVSIDTLNQLFKGKRDITPELAQNLENALGIKAEFWLNLQMDFEIDTIRIKHRDMLNKTRLLNKKKYEIKEAVV